MYRWRLASTTFEPRIGRSRTGLSDVEPKRKRRGQSDDLCDAHREAGRSRRRGLARADRSENVWKLYNAGADFVLSLPTVTGEILASILADETEALTPQTEFGRTEAPAIAGRSLAEVDLCSKTGCTVVAVERDDELVTDVGAELVIRDGDVLVVTGSEEATKRFVEFVR